MDFKKTDIGDVPFLKKYFKPSEDKTCDKTLGGVFMWAETYKTHHCIFDDTLIQRVDINGINGFMMPIGKNVPLALEELYAYCEKDGKQLVFYGLTDIDRKTVSEFFDVTEQYERDICDYVYFSYELADFPGKKFHGQKNHLNAFKRLFSDAYAKRITDEDIEKIKAFFEKYKASVSKDDDMFYEDIRAVQAVLDNTSVYGFDGIAVYIKDEVISFAMGELAGDTMYVHIEKALPEYRGVYQFTVSELAKLARGMGAVYINREDDTGNEGLRTSKLSYKPCFLVDKYTVFVNGKKEF